MASISLGLLILLLSLATHSVELFFIGAAIAGIGSGAAFSALVQTLAPLADEHERAELFAAIFVASYLSLSLAPVVAGFLIAPFGLLQTAQGYLAVLLVVSVLATWTHWRALRRPAAVI
ncbi:MULTISPECIES: MFS transporter [unclassified Pseudomonas]|uniref:MFS transporter n=1 Tax=unclassified Pseudomonas TaxID=196821 RepID=UPI002AC96949|nr:MULTISPECIES: MFS transporter [unclassified Pseudomonas]MEB0039906.1 hypothetical protein [Pseudomonas sp. MH10]MEB0077153.1 hypothetical protein [Pseudomonas sp. MH10out]MEB0093049.1 hypothetical protein [Pseudomonas sp. CCI4.2]MEB0102252.1 hypothetical protein [Pseudomonas sp. CCI3.2]MEB0123532.1 hypothetical protein [Pseudomonas sp. CCI1.2]